jgi:hypothetical protein
MQSWNLIPENATVHPEFETQGLRPRMLFILRHLSYGTRDLGRNGSANEW